MKYLSVCSGIEAATVAWHGLGWTPVAFSEIEAFPAAVLKHHYPTVPNLGDLTKYREWPEELLVEVDLLVGGTPCQAFSVAGLRKSLDDDRGNLSLTFVHLRDHINEVRRKHGRAPVIVVWENVPGVLSTKDNAFGCFIGGLLGCDEAPETESGKWDKAGFLSSETVRVGYRVLDAQYFGVAQRRRRVFLAAVPCELVERFGERACPSEILSLRESVLGNPPTRGASWEGVARATAAGPTGSGRGVERCGEFRGQDDVFDGEPTCFHPTQDPICSTDGSARRQAVAVRTANTGANGHGVADEVTHTIDQVQGQAIAFKPGQSEAVAIDLQNVAIGGDIAGTLDTTRPSRGGGQAVAFTKAKRAQSNEDDESWVPGEVAPTQNQFDQGDTRATTVVALRSGCHTQEDHALYTKGYPARQQNACSQEADSRKVLPLLREEVGEKDFAEWGLGILDSLQGEEVLRSGVLGEGDGAAEEVSDSEAGREVVGGSSQSKKHMPQGRVSKVRKAGRERRASQGWKLSEQLAGELGAYLQELSQQNSPAEEIVRDLRKASEGIRLLHDALPEVQDVGRSAGDEVEPVRSTSEMQRGHQAQPMCVRRLTATECEFLQGFPENYTLVTYRKKPAADGPRYRALGNSMAVPCMWWLGHRIHKATSGECK